jgi:hypothetical protein
MNRGIAFFLGFAALAAVFAVLVSQRPSSTRTTGLDTYSDDVLGHEALPEVMRRLGVHVLVDRRGTYRFADAPVFFIEPRLRTLDAHDHPEQLARVLAQRSADGHDSVLVLPKWRANSPGHNPVSRAYKTDVERVLSAAIHPGALELRREDTDVPETAALRQWTVPGRAGPRRVVLLERQTFRVHDDRIEVLLGTHRSALVVRIPPSRPGADGGSIFLVSDPDLLHNFNQHRGDHAQIVLDVLDAADSDTLVIDEVFHGHAFEDTTASVLGSTGAVIVVAHLFGLALLHLWAGARTFGGPARTGSAASSSEVLLGLAGQALAPPSGPATPGLVGAYITLILSDAADRLAIAASDSLMARAQALDDMASRRGIAAGRSTSPGRPRPSPTPAPSFSGSLAEPMRCTNDSST